MIPIFLFVLICTQFLRFVLAKIVSVKLKIKTQKTYGKN